MVGRIYEGSRIRLDSDSDKVMAGIQHWRQVAKKPLKKPKRTRADMTTLRRFNAEDLFSFSNINLDHLTETVGSLLEKYYTRELKETALEHESTVGTIEVPSALGSLVHWAQMCTLDGNKKIGNKRLIDYTHITCACSGVYVASSCNQAVHVISSHDEWHYSERPWHSFSRWQPENSWERYLSRWER